MVIRFDIFRQVTTMFCIAAGVAVAGCALPPTPAADYRIQHPIAAQEKIFSLIVPLSSSGQAASVQHRRRIMNFAGDYLRRGRGPILISQGGSVATAGEPRSMIAGLLVEAGVSKQMIYLQGRSENNSNRNTAELSYAGYSVRLPKCGDWSGQAGFDPSNRSHTDFGCSYQRNIGLMLSNPGDLSIAGGSIEGDAKSSDRVTTTVLPRTPGLKVASFWVAGMGAFAMLGKSVKLCTSNIRSLQGIK